jgi:cbb3-type cytochrome oxidase subunit 3
MMELLRPLMTVLAVAAFFAILWWAYAPSRKAQWELKGVLIDDEVSHD